LNYLFLIEFLLIAGIVLAWIAYEYFSVKKLSRQRELDAQRSSSITDKDSKSVLYILCFVLVSSGCATVPEQAATANGYGLVETGTVASPSGCLIHFTRYRPRSTTSDHTLVLGHGFLRNQSYMAGLANAVAKSGVSVVTLNYCNMRFFNGNHEKNADDMVTLVKHLALRKPVYGGLSAGALAALVAASKDSSSIAVLALDLVDDAGLAARALNTLDIPVYSLSGGPSSCNRNSKAATLFQRYDNVDTVLIDTASHCDFEMPTNWLCELFCGKSKSTEPETTAPNRIIDQVIRIIRTIDEQGKEEIPS